MAAVALLLASALVLIGCQAEATPAQAPAQKPAPAAQQPAKEAAAPAQPAPTVEQKLNIGIGMLPKNLDPHMDSGLVTHAVYPMLYDALIRVDDKGNAIPGLAESWTLLDNNTWQFKLRKGVKFHSGEPFNAEAVKFNLDRLSNPASKSPFLGRFAPIDRMDVVDEYTLNVHTKDPWAIMPKQTLIAFMVSPKDVQQKGDSGFANSPVGTGPFKFKEWKQDNYVTLEANPDYWGGAPKLKTITVRAFPEASTMVAALEKGEIDIAYQIPPEGAQRLKDKGLNIVSRPTGQSLVFLERSTMSGPLAKKEVRQAIQYAIDKQAIVDKLLGGYGRVLDGQLVGPEAFGYDPNLKAFPYDPAKAKKMLADAGYPNGFTVKVHGSIGRYIKDKEISEAIATQLADVGIKADLEILESTVWYDMYTKGTSGPIVINGSTWAPVFDLELATSYYLSDQRGKKILDSKRFDEAYDKVQRTMDPKEREKALWTLAEVLNDESAVLFMFQIPGIYAVNKKVQDIDFNASYTMKNLPGIYIK